MEGSFLLIAVPDKMNSERYNIISSDILNSEFDVIGAGTLLKQRKRSHGWRSYATRIPDGIGSRRVSVRSGAIPEFRIK